MSTIFGLKTGFPYVNMRLFFVILLASFSTGLMSQEAIENKLFSSPLEIPLYLAGNFGELRSNHFHAGLDIKTKGHEGLKVLAVADGYVSRIKVSPFGYGLALYIRHPNGYTSVYGHLKKYNKDIQAYVKKNQYKAQSYKIELFPKASEFPVVQGEIIAISGNSGGSVAPHLHFEIRETASESPINPLQFGFDIKDDIQPVLQSLYVYPKSEKAEINGKRNRLIFPFSGTGGSYFINPKYKIESYGEITFGIKMYDQLNEVHNHCGLRDVKLFRNNKLIYHHSMDKVSFPEMRYINAFADYSEKIKKNKWVHQSFILPNNKLKIYELNEPGITNVPEGEIYHFKYVVTDFYGNESIANFDVKGANRENMTESIIAQKPVKRFKYSQANSFERNDVLVYLPANVLYEDLNFKYWLSDTLERALTPTYNIHDLYTPLHSYMALSLKLENFKSKLKPFAMIVSLDNEGEIVPEGGYWKGNYLIVKTRSFGAYTVMIDSVKPKLTPINIPANKDMSKKWSIMVKAEDNLSGVHKYNAYIDGKWVLTEFDYKKKRLIHYFEDDLAKGKHSFMLEVKDKKGNTSVYTVDFLR